MQQSPSSRACRAGAALLGLLLASPLTAQMLFDFEEVDQLAGNSEVSGDLDFWTESTDQALSGTQSLVVNPSAQQSFRSLSYNVPFPLEEGTISVWFYDTVGQGAGTFTWGGSIILEDADNPADFVAVEINDLPYAGAPGALPYHATEGVVDRGITGDSYDANSLAVRSVGWHEVVFEVGPTTTTVTVDGVGPADEVEGPGGAGRDLRLRIMGDSAKAGGFGNWTSSPSGFPSPPRLAYYDSVTFSSTAPTSQTVTLDFEDDDGFGNPEYDTVGEFMGPAAYDEPNMRGFVNNFAATTDQAYSGNNSITFDPGDPAFQSIVIDLSTASPGTITIPFYDALGQNQGFDKIGASFIIEDGSDPSVFIAAEVWNAPYPFAAADKTYYFVERPIPGGARDGFYSGYFGPRAVGWQTLEIELTDTYSRMTINGVGADSDNANTVYDGPGLDANPKLRIMADSPTMGGFNNWTDSSNWTDPETPELDTLYLGKTETYLYLDDVSLPLPAITSVEDWWLLE